MTLANQRDAAFYRIRKGVKPWGGKLFQTDSISDNVATGWVITTYKAHGPYAYKLDELEPR